MLIECFPRLFEQLVRYGRRLRVTEEEAQDLAMKAWQWAWLKSGGAAASLSSEDFKRVVFRKTKQLAFDLLASADRRRTASLDDAAESSLSDMPEAYRLFLRVYWDEVLRLEPRVRAAILLAMDEDLLDMLHPRGRGELPSAIPLWSPPPPLERLPLPASETLIAQKLGVSVENLQAIRSRGKKRLLAAVKAWGDGGS